ncbi:ribose 5-phosphate isomerase A [Methanocella sp. CWC-04]|uniref:Ribose-5-phosphate isomerase A n=1 Tax=Methanooceanicella nereidis TaxID=2052831 RepID=A0AAP2RCJ7_9EURY|nr:ribose-5-phosphate isomerase RpiA [Methanocella sp. CWC-04]MCD1294833.1 ribose 5-phosphate isomerase A [Methanocella sp. CWC-04]
MKNLSGSEEAKRNAAEKACELVTDGMVVGLGTGSTTAHAIKYLGRKVVEDGLKIKGVPTSYASEALAIECGIPLTSLTESPELDIAIDGADQVDAALNVIKGGGAAHTREKIVSMSAAKFVVIIDDKKYTDVLARSVPIEVIPYARRLVEKELSKLGGKCTVRSGTGKDGPVISDNGNMILDCEFGRILEPAALSVKLSRIPGLVEHGIFTNASMVYIGYEDKVEVRSRKM